eukprot:5107069-Pleurochrysis_carterae.AAC.1
MDVGRTCCRVDAGVSEELFELCRQKLASIVGVECANDLTRLVSVLIDERGERSDEAFDMRRSFRLSPHRVGGFESRVIVHED